MLQPSIQLVLYHLCIFDLLQVDFLQKLFINIAHGVRNLAHEGVGGCWLIFSEFI